MASMIKADGDPLHSIAVPCSHATVVVADDDAILRGLVRWCLEADGYNIIEALDGLDALRALRCTEAAALVTDLVMPKLDGAQLVRELRRLPQTALLPVIVMTGLPPGDDRVVALNGADGVRLLFKPFFSLDLCQSVRELTDDASAKEEQRPTHISTTVKSDP